jgi:hypothetical protein
MYLQNQAIPTTAGVSGYANGPMCEPPSAITLGTNLSQLRGQLDEVEKLTAYLGDKLGGPIPTQGNDNAKNPNVPSVIECTSDAIRLLDRILNHFYRCNQILG